MGMQFVCMVGIVFFYTKFSLLQETLLDKSLKLHINLVMMIQNLVALTVSTAIISAQGKLQELASAFTKANLKVALLNYGAFTLSYLAMKEVSYTFVLLTMCAKIIPVLIVGTIRGVYSPNVKQVLLAVGLSSGLIIFNLGKMDTKGCEFGGLGLLLGGLLFEGL